MKSDWILWDPLAIDLNSTPSRSISCGKHHSTMLPVEKYSMKAVLVKQHGNGPNRWPLTKKDIPSSIPILGESSLYKKKDKQEMIRKKLFLCFQAHFLRYHRYSWPVQSIKINMIVRSNQGVVAISAMRQPSTDIIGLKRRKTSLFRTLPWQLKFPHRMAKYCFLFLRPPSHYSLVCMSLLLVYLENCAWKSPAS